MRNRRIPLALLPLLLLVPLLLPATARANAGPPLVLIEGDEQTLVPNKNVQIEILSERLTYDIRVEADAAQADVRAAYAMSNTTDAPVELLVAFVSCNGMREPDVAFRGEAVPILEHRSLSIPGQTARERLSRTSYDRERWLDPGLYAGIPFSQVLTLMSGGEAQPPAPNPTKDAERRVLFVTLFTLSFRAGETCEMVVSYPEKATGLRERGFFYSYKPATLQFLYYLEPASYWKDFHDLTIEVKVDAANVSFGLPGFVRKGSTYTAHFDELPGDNLLIEIETANARVLTIVLVAAGFLVVLLLVWFLRRSIIAGRTTRASRTPKGDGTDGAEGER